ncbi:MULTISPECIES: hypothetical protein [unclassified Synechocystis]|nr:MULTISPECIES: hypothetical protein [unclassified Synechocystis]
MGATIKPRHRANPRVTNPDTGSDSQQTRQKSDQPRKKYFDHQQ